MKNYCVRLLSLIMAILLPIITVVRMNKALEWLFRECDEERGRWDHFSMENRQLMLAARLRHVPGTNWDMLRYLDMSRLSEASKAA